MLHAPCSMLHAPCSLLHAPCSMLHAPFSMLHGPCPLFFLVGFKNLGFNFLCQFRIIFKELFNCISSLTKFCIPIAEPRAAFLDKVKLSCQIYYFTCF